MKQDQICIWWPVLCSSSHTRFCRLRLLPRPCLILAGVLRVIGLSGAGPSRDVSGGCLSGAVSSSRPGNAVPEASFSLCQRWDIWRSIAGQQVPALNPWAWLAQAPALHCWKGDAQMWCSEYENHLCNRRCCSQSSSKCQMGHRTLMATICPHFSIFQFPDAKLKWQHSVTTCLKSNPCCFSDQGRMHGLLSFGQILIFHRAQANLKQSSLLIAGPFPYQSSFSLILETICSCVVICYTHPFLENNSCFPDQKAFLTKQLV